MGWETIAMIGLKAVTASQAQSQGKKAAKATIAEGNIAAENQAQQIQRKAATQTVSFLNSGISLEGTPQNVISSTYKTGLQDLNQISSNYNNAAKNQITAARTKAISEMASSVTGLLGPTTTSPLGLPAGATDLEDQMPWLPQGPPKPLGDEMPWLTPSLVDDAPEIQLPKSPYRYSQ